MNKLNDIFYEYNADFHSVLKNMLPDNNVWKVYCPLEKNYLNQYTPAPYLGGKEKTVIYSTRVGWGVEMTIHHILSLHYSNSGAIKNEFRVDDNFLSQIDFDDLKFFISTLIYKKFNWVNIDAITDIFNQVLIFIDFFKKAINQYPKIRRSDIVFKPVFGKIINGSEADLYIDNMIIDFKSSKKPQITLENKTQLYGYALAAMISQIIDVEKYDKSGIHGASAGGNGPFRYIKNDITSIGFYRSRYGDLHYLILSDLEASKIVNDLITYRNCCLNRHKAGIKLIIKGSDSRGPLPKEAEQELRTEFKIIEDIYSNDLTDEKIVNYTNTHFTNRVR